MEIFPSPIEIKFQPDAAQLQAARAHLQKQQGERGVRQGFWRALVAGVLIGMLWHMTRGSYPQWAWALAILALAAQVIWTLAATRAARTAQAVPDAEGEYALTLAAEGLTLRGPDGRAGFHAWPALAALETADSHVYFHLRRAAAIAVPRAALAGEGAQDLVSAARGLWQAHPANGGQTLPGAPATPETPIYQLLANLRQAARLVLFFKFDPQSFRVSRGALFWLLLADAILQGVTDYLEALPLPVFNWAGVSLFGLSVLVLLGWAAAVGGLMAQRATVLRLLVMAESVLLLFNLIFLPLVMKLEQWLPDAGYLALGIMIILACMLLWMLTALVRIIRGLYGKSYFAAVFMGGAYVLFAITLSLLIPQGDLYLNAAEVQPASAMAPHTGKASGAKPANAKQPAAAAITEDGDEEDDDGAPGDDEDEDEAVADRDPAANLDVEDIYYRQPGMVRQVLEGVKPRRSGETGLYFVGFAGDASEHEFGNEVRYARGVLDSRFNTAGRSLLLINSYDSVNETPLANTHNMEAVLQGLSSRMDRNNDVLFLFLSSHGAQDHRLAINFGPLEMNDLKAEKLKELLDKSGIRNRVIVVSACYSGGFLDVLKDDNTLILTASRRDHVAYGCGDVTEYTFFGEAYFVKALRHHDSFITAFDEARGLIAEREKKEGMEASGPQIHVGRNIGKVLEKLKVRQVGLKAKPAGGKKFTPQQCPDDCPGEPG